MSIISESVTKGYVMILCGGRSGSIMYQGKESRFDDLLCKTLCVYWIKSYPGTDHYPIRNYISIQIRHYFWEAYISEVCSISASVIQNLC